MSTPIEASLAERDAQADLAILHLASPQTIAQPSCPIESFASVDSVPQGTELVVLGYPVGRDLSVTGGVLSNQEEAGRWQTDATMNVGNSGGPVFDLRGYLLGFAVAGMTWYGDGDHGYFVSGVNFFVPIARVLTSSVAGRLRAPPPCWALADAPVLTGGQNAFAELVRSSPDVVGGALGALASNVGTNSSSSLRTSIASVARSEGPGPRLNAPIEPRDGTVMPVSPAATSDRHPETPETLLVELPREVSISLRKEDHPGFSPSSKVFVRRIVADPGYKIEACSLDSASANNAERTQCTISPDGLSVVFRTTLTSGPFFDRWRGWWHGQAVLKQRLIEQ